MPIRWTTAIAALSWMGLTAWALSPPWSPPRVPLWLSIAYPPLHLAVAGCFYLRAVRAPADPAWPARLRLLSWHRAAPRLRAVSFGGRVFPVVVMSGPWSAQPPEIRCALLAHEAAHLEGSHMLWLPVLPVALLALLPDGYGSFLLAGAVCATVNRRLELAADRRAARLVGDDPCRTMLMAVGEDRHWPRLSAIPVLCLLMTHPPLADRLAALTRSA